MTYIRGILCLILCLCLCVSEASALVWPQMPTANESRLIFYIDSVNLVLDQLKGDQINSVFECYDSFASLGVTAVSDADSCEQVEVIVQMSRGSIDYLQLEVSDFSNFATLCAALTSVAAGDSANARNYLKEPEAYVKRVQKSPQTSFEDTVIYDRGDQARTYYAYEPDAYGDGRNCLIMTLIFPRDSAVNEGALHTPEPTRVPESELDGTDDEGDYTPYDEGIHFEVFVTPTPEPDSAAGDELFFW